MLRTASAADGSWAISAVVSEARDAGSVCNAPPN